MNYLLSLGGGNATLSLNASPKIPRETLASSWERYKLTAQLHYIILLFTPLIHPYLHPYTGECFRIATITLTVISNAHWESQTQIFGYMHHPESHS